MTVHSRVLVVVLVGWEMHSIARPPQRSAVGMTFCSGVGSDPILSQAVATRVQRGQLPGRRNSYSSPRRDDMARSLSTFLRTHRLLSGLLLLTFLLALTKR